MTLEPGWQETQSGLAVPTDALRDRSVWTPEFRAFMRAIDDHLPEVQEWVAKSLAARGPHRLVGFFVRSIGEPFGSAANAIGVAIYGTQNSATVSLGLCIIPQLEGTLQGNTWGSDTALEVCDENTALSCGAINGDDLIDGEAVRFHLSYVVEAVN